MDVGYLQRVGLDITSGPAPSHVLGFCGGGREKPAATLAAPSQPSASAVQMNGHTRPFGADLLGRSFESAPVIRGNHPPWLVPSEGHDAKLQVVNSLTGEKEPFRPLQGKKVSWYTCGPTVYDVSHMGHARAYLTFDILRRIMQNYLGFDVRYHINITDIDDKIILRSRQNKLFLDFSKEAPSMPADALRKVVEDALEFAEAKLKKKEPQKPPPDASEKDQKEYETSLQEHELKLGQHAELLRRAQDALNSGQTEAILATAREALMAKLDKERGHTVTDQSIFEAHARKYEDEYFEDMDALGIVRPDVVTRITSYMDGRVQKFIERLEELGVAYEAAGSVYFDIEAFQSLGYKYRKLVPAVCTSHKEMEEGEGALADVAAEEAEKKNKNDFALWKKSKPGEPAWDSKWGPGRPGWHIECSVMATDINGEYLDIHAGGEDLKFPHHDNEMAQSEAFLQRSQWVNYFWHAGHLHIEGLKMSKSLKNFITIRQALAVHTPRQLRLMFLMQAWDKGMNYSDQAIDMAKAEERKLKHFFGSLAFFSRFPHGTNPGERDAKLTASLAACREAVHAAILDNFATPKVIEAVSRLLAEGEAYMGALPEVSLEPAEQVARFVTEIMGVLGVDGLHKEPANKDVWAPVLDSFAGLRQDIRELARAKAAPDKVLALLDRTAPAVGSAKEAGLAEVASALEAFREDLRRMAEAGDAATEWLKRCDVVRDVDFVALGVRLEDRGTDRYLWMFDDRKALEAEQRDAEEKAKEAAKQKIRNRLDQKLKELRTAEKAAIRPEELFRSSAYADLYSDLDAEGIPRIVRVEGKPQEVSANKKKDLKKDLLKQQKDYEKLQKQAGNEGIEAFLAKLREEVREMERQVAA